MQATCLIDLFARTRYSDEDVDKLRSVVMRCKKSQKFGCWDKIMVLKYEKCMPKHTSEQFRFAVYDDRASQNLVYMHLLFFVMMAYEPCVQTIIVRQLKRVDDVDRLNFFQNVFIQQARLYIDLLFVYSYTEENAKYVLTIITTELRSSWALQLDWKYVLTRDAEKRSIQRDIQIAKENKLAQAKMKQKTGRKKRRKQPEELNAT